MLPNSQPVEAVSMRRRWTSNLSRRPPSLLHVFYCIDRKIRKPALASLSLPEKVCGVVYCRWRDSVAGSMPTEVKRHCQRFLPLAQSLQQQSDMNDLEGFVWIGFQCVQAPSDMGSDMICWPSLQRLQKNPVFVSAKAVTLFPVSQQSRALGQRITPYHLVLSADCKDALLWPSDM
jgi:hypothetical protein